MLTRRTVLFASVASLVAIVPARAFTFQPYGAEV